MNNDKKHEFISKVWTENMGGGIMADFIMLKSGQVICISDECVGLYKDQNDFDFGQHDQKSFLFFTTETPTHSAEMLVYIESIQDEILADAQLSLCTSFAELHDFCDANVLGDIEERTFATSEEMITFANEGMNAIDLWLKTGGAQ